MQIKTRSYDKEYNKMPRTFKICPDDKKKGKNSLDKAQLNRVQKVPLTDGGIYLSLTLILCVRNVCKNNSKFIKNKKTWPSLQCSLFRTYMNSMTNSN